MGTRYATTTDLAKYGLPAAVLETIPTDEQEAALDAASSMADDYLADIVDLPLTTWPISLRRAVCKIAAYDLLSVRGFNPEGSDKLIVDEYERSLKWLQSVASGDVPFTPAEDPPAPALVAPPAVDTLEAPYTAAANRTSYSGF